MVVVSATALARELSRGSSTLTKTLGCGRRAFCRHLLLGFYSHQVSLNLVTGRTELEQLTRAG
jgi:hypothetical protein